MITKLFSRFVRQEERREPVPNGGIPVLERGDAVRVGRTWHRIYALVPPEETDVGYAALLMLHEQLVMRGRAVWVAAEVSPGTFRFGYWARKRLRRIELTTQAESVEPGALEDERETGAAAALRAIHAAIRRREPLARWKLLAGVSAQTYQDVVAAGEEFRTAAEQVGFQAEILADRQWPTFRRVWMGGPPIPADLPGRLAPISSAAGLVPSAGGNAGDARGVYFGHRLADGRRVMVDLFSGSSDSNIVVAGRNGSGKSTFLKALTLSLRSLGHRTLVVDLDGEGRAQCTALGGVWMDLTVATGRYIDPLILPPPADVPDWLPVTDAEAVREWNRSRLPLAVEAVKGFVSLLAGSHWTPEASAATHRAVLDALAASGIDPGDQETWGQGTTMAAWWTALKELAGGGRADPTVRAAARRLTGILEQYFDGPLALFREPVALADADAIWIHMAAAMSQGTDRLAATAKITLALTTLWSVTVHERVRGRRFTALFFDEGQRLLENEAVAATVLELVTAVRKYNAMVILATNMPQVFWHTKGGRAAWQQSSYRVLFGLEDSARRELLQAAPDEDGSGVPRSVLARLADVGHKGTELEHAYLFRHPVRGWDECVLKLPDEELALYRTRGLRADAPGFGDL